MKLTTLTAFLATTVVVAGVPSPGGRAVLAQGAGTGSPALPVLVEVQGGTARFDASTNVSAITVRGSSTQLRGQARIRDTGDSLAIEELAAAVPVSTLKTGMGVRDTHMRKYVFTSADGRQPDLTFTADRGECASAGAGKSSCRLTGHLSIRETPRPFAITLEVSKANGQYRASGDGVVLLSAYGIPLPSELGVTTKDEVKLHLEFSAKPTAQRVAARAGGER